MTSSRQDLFNTLMQAHQGRIRTFLYRLTKDHALADDLAQDTFIRAYHKLHQIGGADGHKAWLYKIAYRLFLDHVRKQGRRADLEEKYQDDDPPEVAQVDGVLMDVKNAMNALAPKQRACVILCLSYGFTHIEASEVLNLPVGTVKSHVVRGKTKLRAFLSAYEKA